MIQEMQQTYGNRATQRMIQRAQATPPPGSATGSGFTPFAPRIAATPTQATVALGDTHSETYRVENAAAAPSGTTYRWQDGPHDTKLQELPATDGPQGTLHTRRLRAQAPGTTALTGTLQFNPPVYGVGWIDVPEPSVPITVPAAAIEHVQVSSAGGGALGGPTHSQLKQGDSLTVQVQLGNLSSHPNAVPINFEVTDTGRNGKAAKPTIVQGTPVSPGVYQFTIPTPAVDSHTFQIKALVGQTPTADAPTACFQADVVMDLTRFKDLCDLARTRASQAYHHASQTVSASATAYKHAYDQYSGALKGQHDREKLEMDLLLNSVLAFLGGAVGGAVGSMAKNILEKYLITGTASAVLADGFKDLAKWGVRTAGNPPNRSSADTGLQERPNDPADYQGYMTRIVEKEEEAVDKQIGDWQEAAVNNPHFVANFDPMDVLNTALYFDGQPISELPIPNVGPLAHQIETGMWKGWLQRYAYRLGMLPSPFVSPIGISGPANAYAQENYGDEVKARLAELGISAAELQAWTDPMRRQIQHEADELNGRSSP